MPSYAAGDAKGRPPAVGRIHNSHDCITCGGFVGCNKCGSVISTPQHSALNTECRGWCPIGAQGPFRRLLQGKQPWGELWPNGEEELLQHSAGVGYHSVWAFFISSPSKSTEHLIILYIALALKDTTAHWHLSSSYGGSSVTLRLKRNVDSHSSRFIPPLSLQRSTAFVSFSCSVQILAI